MKLRIGIVISMIAMISVSTAGSITFSPDNGEIVPGCLVAVDVVVDTKGQAIATTDVMIQTDLEYIDFVPSKNIFPYFFPPKVTEGGIHIIGFIANPKQPIAGRGSIGKVFFKQKDIQQHEVNIALYFDGPGKTHDSNLSILGGIDSLDHVGEARFRFTQRDTATCEYPPEYKIVGGFAHMSPEEALNKTIRKIKRKQRFTRKNILPLGLLLIIGIVLFVYKKKQGAGK